MPVCGTEALGLSEGGVVEEESRRTGGVVDGFAVGPRDAVREAGAEGLHRGLFGGEAGGEVLVIPSPPPTAVIVWTANFLFARGEAAGEELVAVLGEHSANA